MTSRAPPTARLRALALPALIVAACFLPWLELWNVLPWGADATKWVGRASLEADWVGWVFFRKHFVGYRPVTALTFVLNHATTGYAAWGYRLTDLALHAASMLALLGVWRSWTKDRSWLGLVPVFLVLAHPATEEVVPYSTRRSYLLATLFGLAGVACHARMLAGGPRWLLWSVACAASSALAVLSNEVAYVLPPVLLIHGLLLPSALGRRRALLGLLPLLAVGVGAVLARHAVLGAWSGGYQKLFFAVVSNGVPKWTEKTAWDPLAILLACGRYTLAPHGVNGEGPLLPYGWPRDVLASALAAWFGWVGLVRPLLRWKEPERRLPLVLAAWAVGSLLIVVLTRTWFWRQSHAILLPLGLLAALALRDALRDRRRADLPGAVGAVLLLAAALPFGSLAGGVSLRPHGLAITGTRIVHRMEEALPSGPGVVLLSVPMSGSAAHVARIWGDRIGEANDLRFSLFASLRGHTERSRVTAELEDRRLTLSMAYKPEAAAPSRGAAVNSWRLEDLSRAGAPRTWVMALDHESTLVAEVPRAAGAAPGPIEPAPPEEEDELPEDEP